MDEQKNKLTVPVAILISGALIAGAVLFTQQPRNIETAQNNVKDEGILEPVNSEDHILGNPNAPIVMVEFSDTSCPFCKTFHPTMKKIMDEYGKDGKVAWVYRHFPLDKPNINGQILHPNAGIEAHAMECANELGGNAKFWEYANRIYEITPSTSGQSLDTAELPKIAKFIGLDEASFNACQASKKYVSKIDAHYTDGLNAGVLGTPFTFVLTKSGKKIPINGAQSYSIVKGIVDGIISEEIK
jgi:protein-disulfide isomerase